MNDNKTEGTEALEILRKHYIPHHSIDGNNYYFSYFCLPTIQRNVAFEIKNLNTVR